MKRLLAALALLVAAVSAVAQTYVTNTVPGGQFNPTDPNYMDITSNTAQGGGMVFDFPTSGGNPDGYARIADNSGGTQWGVWVIGQPTAIPLTDMGLTSDQTYTFLMDMKIEAGANIGGLKVESWGPSGEIIPNSGDMRPASGSTSWATYEFKYKVNPGATALKVVGLWGANSTNAFDNVRVVALASMPLTAQITSPANGATVNTNYSINVSASVYPGVVTEVTFYDGDNVLGIDNLPPFQLAVTGANPGAAALTAVAMSDNGSFVTSSVVNITVASVIPETIVRVDPSKTWQGWMNVFQTPQNFGGYLWGSGWGVAALSAEFSGAGPTSVLTLRPAPMADTNAYWYDYTDPSYPIAANGAVGFKDMEANFYVQVPDGSLNGNKVTFTGTCLANTLVSPFSTNLIGNGWTNYAFIKDLSPDSSSSVIAVMPLTSGVPFSVSLETIADPARHIQYGFVTRGPNVWPTDVDNYGSVKIQSLDANPLKLNVDSAANWVGYMNVFNKPQSGGGYQFGSGWGTADLCAVFNGYGLTLSPNTIGDPNEYWYTPSGGPGSVGNKTMDANMYVELGSLPGRNLTFSGTVLSNTLVSASNTNALGNGWTSVAFIKDYAPDYSTVNQITVPLTPGNFSINLYTINEPGRHVQYGFETIGPNVWVTDVAPYGNVVIANVGTLPTTLKAAGSNGKINLTFASQLGKSYTVQYKTNLLDSSWGALTTTNGTGANILISDPVNADPRFYRLLIQ